MFMEIPFGLQGFYKEKKFMRKTGNKNRVREFVEMAGKDFLIIKSGMVFLLL